MKKTTAIFYLLTSFSPIFSSQNLKSNSNVPNADNQITRELALCLVDETIHGKSKIVFSAQEANEITQVWHLQHLKIGFTNGCFDLLHPGHISMLRQARAACDKLVVGINSDESVRRLKGKDRP